MREENMRRKGGISSTTQDPTAEDNGATAVADMGKETEGTGNRIKLATPDSTVQGWWLQTNALIV